MVTLNFYSFFVLHKLLIFIPVTFETWLHKYLIQAACVVTTLTKEFDFEIATTYCVLQVEKTVISFIRVIIIIEL